MTMFDALPGMAHIEAAEFVMGSDSHYPEEAPAFLASVNSFWIDKHPVTNANFTAFVDATGYVTVAEQAPNPQDYPEASPALLYPGSLVFKAPAESVALSDWRRWWAFVENACWRRPCGDGSSIDALAHHPVVHVAYADAVAYTAWVGKELPSEVEWEYAARGGLTGAAFAWGGELAPDGRMMANYWQGQFPNEQLALDGFSGTSPVTAFPPNGFGLYDMIGNVWEWTADSYRPSHAQPEGKCCTPDVLRNNQESQRLGDPHAHNRIPTNVVKGGSHLCASNYCERYRPAARSAQTVDTSSCHIGFRCVVRGERLLRA